MLSQLRSFMLLAATFASPSLFAAGKYAVDWKALEPEILEHYSNLIRIDTSSPPGNETKAAEYLKKVLDREGIPAQIYELEPGRGNVLARLKGNGSKKPILLGPPGRGRRAKRQVDRGSLRGPAQRLLHLRPRLESWNEKDAAGGGGAHGDDERLKESSLYKEVEFIWRSVLPVAASK